MNHANYRKPRAEALGYIVVQILLRNEVLRSADF
jgi:hypothetical protein